MIAWVFMLSSSSMQGRGPSTIWGHAMLVCSSLGRRQTIGQTLKCILLGMSCLGTSKGLLELYHVPADSSTEYMSGNDYTRPGVGFGHVGFTVPDVPAALERVQKFGLEVIKPLNDDREDQMGLHPEVEQGKHGIVADGYKHIFRQLAFVKDPDGYWVELVPQVVNPPHT